MFRREQAIGAADSMMPTIEEKESVMLNGIIIVLLVLWLLGMATSYTMGGILHLLLVGAIAVALLRIIEGRNPIRG